MFTGFILKCASIASQSFCVCVCILKTFGPFIFAGVSMLNPLNVINSILFVAKKKVKGNGKTNDLS